MKILTLLLTLNFFAASVSLAGGSTTVGPSNPAGTNCMMLGGKLEAYVTPAGQDAKCAIEEWQLFRHMAKLGLTKAHRYNNHGGVGMPNPASVNCIDVEGKLRMEITAKGGEYGICVIEEWTLFRYINITEPL